MFFNFSQNSCKKLQYTVNKKLPKSCEKVTKHLNNLAFVHVNLGFWNLTKCKSYFENLGIIHNFFKSTDKVMIFIMSSISN